MPPAYEWSALGTYAQLAVNDEQVAGEAARLAQELVARVDATCSRFRDDSDLTRANANDGSWVRVDPMLVQAVEAALYAARFTDGLVDPTLGRRLAELGYDDDLDAVRARPTAVGGEDSASLVQHDKPTSGRWRELATDGAEWLRVPRGSSLDLGATGKAFAADLVARTVATELGCSVVISLGGDVAVGGPTVGTGWPVLVSDTAGGDLDVPGQVVRLAAGGLATSSTLHRRWSNAGAEVHHIIDPRTGMPTDEAVVTASVRASSCVAANAASTAAVILGKNAGAWLTARELPALLVDRNGRSCEYVGWSDRVSVGASC